MMPPPRRPPPVLIVVADLDMRRLIERALEEISLPHVLAPNWRVAVAELAELPPIAICDVDDLEGPIAGMRALVARGWGAPVPLIVLSRRTDVERLAAESLNAVEGLKKPLSVPRLIETVRRVLDLAADE
jgi:DNA-binding NtrC family response regulator